MFLNNAKPSSIPGRMLLTTLHFEEPDGDTVTAKVTYLSGGQPGESWRVSSYVEVVVVDHSIEVYSWGNAVADVTWLKDWSVNVDVTDQDGTDSIQLNFALNNHLPVFDRSRYIFYLPSDAIDGTVLGLVHVTDPDESLGDYVEYNSVAIDPANPIPGIDISITGEVVVTDVAALRSAMAQDANQELNLMALAFDRYIGTTAPWYGTATAPLAIQLLPATTPEQLIDDIVQYVLAWRDQADSIAQTADSCATAGASIVNARDGQLLNEVASAASAMNSNATNLVWSIAALHPVASVGARIGVAAVLASIAAQAMTTAQEPVVDYTVLLQKLNRKLLDTQTAIQTKVVGILGTDRNGRRDPGESAPGSLADFVQSIQGLSIEVQVIRLLDFFNGLKYGSDSEITQGGMQVALDYDPGTMRDANHVAGDLIVKALTKRAASQTDGLFSRSQFGLVDGSWRYTHEERQQGTWQPVYDTGISHAAWLNTIGYTQ